MSQQWQPGQYDPRAHQQRMQGQQTPPAAAPQQQRGPYAHQPQQQYPPQGYGQPPYPQQPHHGQYPLQQPQVFVQQNNQYPTRAVTRGKLNPIETIFHAFMTLCTAGLWGFVWWARVHSKKSVTKFR